MTLLIIASLALLFSVTSIILFKVREGEKATNGIPFTLSIVAIILAFISVAVSLPRQVDKAVEMDYLGVIVGVLSFLITLLIGWQLYSVFKIKDDVQEAKGAKESAKAALKSIKQSEKQAQKSAGEIKAIADKFYQDSESVKQTVSNYLGSAQTASSEAKKAADEIEKQLDGFVLDEEGLRILVKLIIGLTLSNTIDSIKDPAEREKKSLEYYNKVMNLIKRDSV